MDSKICRTTQSQQDFLVNHVALGIRSHASLAAATVYVIFENNLYGVMNHLVPCVARLPGVTVYKETGKHIYGIRKDHPMTMAFREAMIEALAVDSIAFWEHLTTLSAKAFTTRAEILAEAYAQLRRMCIRQEISASGRMSIFMSGKISSFQDDLAIAILMCIMSPRLVLDDQRWVHAIEEQQRRHAA